MKGTSKFISAALICLSGCANCGDQPGENNGEPNNEPAPDVCTPEFQYAEDDWAVTEDRRLIAACSPYIVEDSVNVSESARLTIDPGVTMLFGDGWLRVQDGSIVANGTEDDPIVFSSNANTKEPGSWLGFRFGSDTEAGNEISHAVIEYAGRDQFSQLGCVSIDSGVREGAITLTDITFQNCSQAGLAAVGAPFREVSNLTFTDSEYGMRLGPESVGKIVEAYTYENTPANIIVGGNVESTATWIAQDVPYRVLDSLDVGGDDEPILTLDAGLVLQFTTDDWLRVGISPGSLITTGTESAPVILESSGMTKAAGDWLGIRFGGELNAETSLDYLVVRHAGQDQFSQEGCLTINTGVEGRVAVTNSSFEDCLQAGVAATSEDFAFREFTNNSFINSEAGMSIRPSAVGSVGPQNYEGTEFNRLNGGPVEKSATWGEQDVPWRVTDSINVGGEDSPELVIEAGTYQFQSDQWLRAGISDGSLKIQGSADAPVVFESSQPTKAAGDWLGIRIGGDIGSGTIIEHARISHAGQDQFSTRGAITVDGGTQGRVTLTNLELTDCLQSCIATSSADLTFNDISNITFRNSDAGFSLAGAAVASVSNAATYDGVDENILRGGDVVDDGTWVSQGVPWRVIDSINVGGDNSPVLTIEAGSEFRFTSDNWLRVGISPGSLQVAGTSADPVRFSSAEASGAAGDWLGLRLESDTGNGTVIDYAIIEYAGQDAFSQRGAVTMNGTGSAVTISNSTFSNNLQTDIYVDNGSTPTLTNNTATVTNQ